MKEKTHMVHLLKIHTYDAYKTEQWTVHTWANIIHMFLSQELC